VFSRFELTSGIVTMHRGAETPKHIKLSDVVVLDKTKKGTLLVISGNGRSSITIDRKSRVNLLTHRIGYSYLTSLMDMRSW
jgi:hypothetical protein